MSDIDLWIRFPTMRPVRRPPSLGTVNGIGTQMLGQRDHDDVTDSVVKTRWFTFLGIPLFALDAYRVSPAPLGGFYLLGQVRLTGLIKVWNVLCALLLLGAVGAGGWLWYSNTEDYRTAQRLAEADRLREGGEVGKAARVYKEVMNSRTGHAATAHDRLNELVQSPPDDLGEAVVVYQVAVDLHRENRALTPDLYAVALEHITKHETRDPAGALAVLEAVSPLTDKMTENLQRRRGLLERLVKLSPGEVELASRLAVVLDAQGETASCEGLLLPHEKRLGQLDGGAILGRIHAAQGRLDRASALLAGYVEARLPQLRQAEAAYQNALQACEQRAIQAIRSHLAPDFPFEQFDRAGEAQRQAMFSEYVGKVMREDPAMKAAVRDLLAQSGVGAAALELGIVQLHRAQAMADPEARRQELQKAEQTLLAVGRLADQSDRYHLHLAQVYYWLGKPAEGRKQFDEVLKKHSGKTDVMLSVAHLLREVGATTEARALTEEAYNKEQDPKQKQGAALRRFLLALDLDDRIHWLKRADPESLEVKASLSHALGARAERDGKEAEAIRHYRDALATYARMPEEPGTLNNSSLVHRSLFALTQERDQLQRSADKIVSAVKLMPGDSILLHNAAMTMLLTAARDVVGNAIDSKALRSSPQLDLLGYLYSDQAGKEKTVQKLRTHPGFIKAREYSKQLVVLSPRGAPGYGFLYAMYSTTRDVAGLKGLLDRLKDADLDLERQRSEQRDYYAGKNDAKKRDEMQKEIARAQEALARARKVGGATLAAAASRLMDRQLQAAPLGQPVDADALVKLAEEADRAAPSAATRRSRIEAHCFRAHRALIRADQKYAALARQTARSLGHTLLTWVLSHEGPLCRRALSNADIQKAVKLRLEQVKAFPDDPSLWAWAFLRASNPSAAGRIGKALLVDETRHLQLDIDRILTPLNANTAVETAWMQELAGKRAEADATLAAWAKQGVPVPPR